MGNVNLPTPVVAAGAGLCLLGGYLIGVVAGPDSPDRTTAVVASFNARSGELCLTGEGVEELDGAEDDVLCGVWRKAPGSTDPVKGDRFRFVSSVVRGQKGADDDRILIFGEVDD